ncbi:MAG: hypothetical protein MRJ96_14435 [Nitrospirales bacterium]|nr:hypothetical protein [Nitrospirales bacterium]
MANSVRIQTDPRMALLGFTDLQLTDPELKDVVHLHRPGMLPDEMEGWVLRLQEHTQGWMGGVILALAQAGEIGKRAPDTSDTSVLFDYFATEVLQQQSAQEQEWLLTLSALPSMTRGMAAALTGAEKAGALLERLARRGYFTERRKDVEVQYQFHPRFREFLRAYAQEHWEAEKIHDLQEQAATLLKAEGRREEAMALYVENQQWTEFLNILLPAAPQYMNQGKVQTLAAWLMQIPKDIVAAAPWCQYWQATCVMTTNPDSSVPLFERVFHRFEAEGDQTGILLAWCGIVDAIQLSFRQYSRLDAWVKTLEDFQDAHKEYPSQEIEIRVKATLFSALVSRFGVLIKGDDTSPEFLKLTKEIEEFLHQIPDITIRTQLAWHLWKFYTWKGDLVAARSVLANLSLPIRCYPQATVAHLIFHGMAGFQGWLDHDVQTCLAHYQEGVKYFDKGQSPVLDAWVLEQGVCGYVLNQELLKAMTICDLMLKKFQDDGGVGEIHARIHTAWLASLSGHSDQAISQKERILDLVVNFEFPFMEGHYRICLVFFLIHQKDFIQANEEFQIVKSQTRLMKVQALDYQVAIAEAKLAYVQGKAQHGRQAIAAALSISRTTGFMFLKGVIPDMLAWLCNQALEAGIEEAQAKKIIATLKLSPPSEGVSYKWPFAVRMTTLGNFVLSTEQAEKGPIKKIPKRQVLFLKVLLALGGKDVPQEKMANILWPDADGDRAYRSFIVTLTRVRNMLGHKDAILLESGRVSLNPNRCWIDILAFEQLVARADTTWHEKQVDESLPLYEQARVMYRGPFLPQEDDELWTQSMRVRLDKRYQHVIDQLRTGYEQTGEWSKAVEVLEQTQYVDAPPIL